MLNTGTILWLVLTGGLVIASWGSAPLLNVAEPQSIQAAKVAIQGTSPVLQSDTSDVYELQPALGYRVVQP